MIKGTECPTCDKSLDTERGVKIHHSRVHGESIGRQDVSCHWCGSEFTLPDSRIEAAEKFFCPDENCRGEWLSETNTGENHNNYKKNEHTCDYCGKKFKRIPSHIRGEHTFCGKGCSTDWRSENWVGENNPFYEGGGVEGFTKTEREKVFNRDDYTCQDCGDDTGGNLNAHHIVPKSENKELAHTIKNGITLCIDCHANRHDEPVSSFILTQKS